MLFCFVLCSFILTFAPHGLGSVQETPGICGAGEAFDAQAKGGA